MKKLILLPIIAIALFNVLKFSSNALNNNASTSLANIVRTAMAWGGR